MGINSLKKKRLLLLAQRPRTGGWLYHYYYYLEQEGLIVWVFGGASLTDKGKKELCKLIKGG